MTPEKEVVRKFWECFTQNDLDGCEALLASDAVITFSGKDISVKEYRALGEIYRSAFPDMHYTKLTFYQEGDQVACLGEYTGTQSGDFMGIPATNRTANTRALTLDTVRGGKITRRINLSNDLEMLQQLGVVPAPA